MKITFNDIYNGESLQPPFRSKPGQLKVAYNMRLDPIRGATSRNGTVFVGNIGGEFSPYTGSTVWYTFGDDLIAIRSGAIRVWDILTLTEKYVLDRTNSGFNYVFNNEYTSNGTYNQIISVTSIRDSIIICNKMTTVTASSSANYTVTGTVTDYSTLPTTAIDGQIYLARLPYGTIPAGYYQLNRPANTPSGSAYDWRRIPAPNQATAKLDSATMPHVLIRTASGNYEFNTIDWTQRLSGTEEQNPAPTFVNYKIEAVAAHSGRLFILANGSISASSIRDRYSFFIDNIDNSSDESNPISQDLSNSVIGKCVFAGSTNGVLFAAYEKGQIIFTSNQEQLNAFNGVDIQISDYRTKVVNPSIDGTSIVLLDNTNRAREYLPSANGFNLVYAANLNIYNTSIFDTRTVNKIYRNGGTTFFFCADNLVFVHQKSQSETYDQTGWSRLDFGQEVVHASAHNQDYYLIVKNGQNYSVLRYGHEYDGVTSGFPYALRLDKIITNVGVYDGSTDTTRFSLSYAPNSNTRVLTRNSTSNTNIIHTPVAIGPDYVDIRGNWYDAFSPGGRVGNIYNSYIQLQEFYAGASTTVPNIVDMTVFSSDTATYSVTVRRKESQEAETYLHSAPLLGSQDVSSQTTMTSYETFPVLLDGREAQILISNNTPTAMTISALEFSARTAGRTER